MTVEDRNRIAKEGIPRKEDELIPDQVDETFAGETEKVPAFLGVIDQNVIVPESGDAFRVAGTVPGIARPPEPATMGREAIMEGAAETGVRTRPRVGGVSRREFLKRAGLATAAFTTLVGAAKVAYDLLTGQGQPKPEEHPSSESVPGVNPNPEDPWNIKTVTPPATQNPVTEPPQEPVTPGVQPVNPEASATPDIIRTIKKIPVSAEISPNYENPPVSIDFSGAGMRCKENCGTDHSLWTGMSGKESLREILLHFVVNSDQGSDTFEVYPQDELFNKVAEIMGRTGGRIERDGVNFDLNQGVKVILEPGTMLGNTYPIRTRTQEGVPIFGDGFSVSPEGQLEVHVAINPYFLENFNAGEANTAIIFGLLDALVEAMYPETRGNYGAINMKANEIYGWLLSDGNPGNPYASYAGAGPSSFPVKLSPLSSP